ncbi:MAG: VWA domain-containing protein [Spirochaetaceae bacterium]|jgi:Mg-chelatase subunit ChlD|nr:VWA domain-containing protein [Spirochaetaceae bacterium]
MKTLLILGIFFGVLPVTAQDVNLANKVSGFYKISQTRDPANGVIREIRAGAEDTDVAIMINPPQTPAFTSIDQVWTYLKDVSFAKTFAKPRNICFVLDTSKSMEEPINAGLKNEIRIKWVKWICEILFKDVKETDFISVVIFNDQNKERLILPPTQIRNLDQQKKCIAVVNSLHPQGSTFILEALKMGYDQVQLNYDSNAINRVILLTDGDPTDKKEIDLIKKLVWEKHREEGIATVSTIALSADANKPFMDELATMGGGLSLYVNEFDTERDIASKMKTLIYSDRREIILKLRELFRKTTWELDVDITLQEGVSWKDESPCNGVFPQHRGMTLAYRDIPLSQSNAALIQIRILLDPGSLNRDHVFNVEVSNCNPASTFPECKETFSVSLNETVETESDDWSIFIRRDFGKN